MDSVKKGFVQHLRETLNSEKFDDGLRAVFGTPHRRTKFLNGELAVGDVTHAELLGLAKLLDVTPFSIYSEFGVASNNVKSVELEQLQFVHITVAPDKETAIREIEKFEAAKAA